MMSLQESHRELWKITYTDNRTGLRESYMNIGFESPESAKTEIKRLMRDAKKYKKQGLRYNSNMSWSPTPLIGSYWRVKKIKLKSK